MGVGSFSIKLVDSEIPNVNVSFEQEIEKKKVNTQMVGSRLYVILLMEWYLWLKGNASQPRWRGDW